MANHIVTQSPNSTQVLNSPIYTSWCFKCLRDHPTKAWCPVHRIKLSAVYPFDGCTGVQQIDTDYWFIWREGLPVSWAFGSRADALNELRSVNEYMTRGVA